MKPWVAVLIAVVFGGIGISNIVSGWSTFAPGFSRLYTDHPALVVGMVATFFLLLVTGLLAVFGPRGTKGTRN